MLPGISVHNIIRTYRSDFDVLLVFNVVVKTAAKTRSLRWLVKSFPILTIPLWTPLWTTPPGRTKMTIIGQRPRWWGRRGPPRLGLHLGRFGPILPYLGYIWAGLGQHWSTIGLISTNMCRCWSKYVCMHVSVRVLPHLPSAGLYSSLTPGMPKAGDIQGLRPPRTLGARGAPVPREGTEGPPEAVHVARRRPYSCRWR